MKQKENISDLLKRYILNECSEDEIEIVISYFKSATNSNDIPSVEDVLNLLKEHQKTGKISSDLSFEHILKVAKEKEKAISSRKAPRKVWVKYASIAAIFIGVMASGYIFWQNQIAGNSIIIPSDAITLELEDGSIEILNQDGSKEVIDKNGRILGQQTGGQISYEGASSTEELAYNTLTVPHGNRFDLKLSDGTTIYLNAGSSLKYPVKFLDGHDRKVYLAGEAYFDVSKNESSPFIVNVNELDVKVLGTEFNVSAYAEDTNIDVVLVEGAVSLNTDDVLQKEPTLLSPGQKGSFKQASKEISVARVNTALYTSWMQGHLVFRDLTFDQILAKLERHYNVEIENTNVELGKEVFNASFNKVEIEEVLSFFNDTHEIDYTIENNKIIIE
ncbi:MAG: FecR family protein [Aurantibacter sp.]